MPKGTPLTGLIFWCLLLPSGFMACSTEPTNDSDTDTDTDTTEGLIRLGQSVGVTVNDDPVGEGLEFLPGLWKNHLDAIEINVTGDWKIREWSSEGTVQERATRESKGMAEDVQTWLQAFHDEGLQGAVAINWQGSMPAINYEAMSKSPALAPYRAYTFNLETGKREESLGFDWTNADARAYALGVFTDVSALIGPTADWLFMNEMSFNRDSEWYDTALFSDAAVSDFKAFSGTDKGIPIDPTDLPDGVKIPDTEAHLYNQSPSDADWEHFKQWRYHQYTRRVETLTLGFAAGQADNPTYRGAIWFANADEVGTDALHLDAVFQIEGIHYFVAENLTTPTPDRPNWAAWLTAAETHKRKLGTFVPLSARDGSGYKPGCTPSTMDLLLEQSIAAEVGMVTMYYAGSYDPTPDSEFALGSYRETLVDIWDDWTHPDGPDADPTDWTITDE